MFVTTMKQKQRFIASLRGNPRAIEELETVPGLECALSGFHLFDAVRLLLHAIPQRFRRRPFCPGSASDSCAAFRRSIEPFLGAAAAGLLATPEKIHR